MPYGYTLSDLANMPPEVYPRTTDEEKIRRLMGGRPLLPVEYDDLVRRGPAPPMQAIPPGRQMTPADVQLLRSGSALPRSHWLYRDRKADAAARLTQDVYGRDSEGMTPAVGPMSMLDMVMEPAGQFAEELLGGTTLGALMLGAVVGPKAAKHLPVGRGALTGQNILDAAARLNRGEGISFKDWVNRNPQGGTSLFDVANAAPAGVFPSGPIPRYTPRNVPDRMVEAFADPRTRKQLRDWVEAGMQMMPEPWYRTGPLYDAFVAEWGPQQAPGQMQKFLEYVAATSTSAKVPDNLKIASYYNYIDQQGLPIPATPPPGYGHKFQGSHRAAAQDFRQGTFNPIDKPKRGSYVQNLGGNEDVLTGDRHWMRAVGMASKDPRFLKTRFEVEVKGPDGKPLKGPDGKNVKIYRNLQEEFREGKLTLKEALNKPGYWDEAPTKTEYEFGESAWRKLARRMGLTAGQAQEKMWVGAGRKTGLGSPPEPILTTLGRRIAYTAYQMGTTPEEVLSAFVKGKIPLLQFGGATLGLGTLSSLADYGRPDAAEPPDRF